MSQNNLIIKCAVRSNICCALRIKFNLFNSPRVSYYLAHPTWLLMDRPIIKKSLNWLYDYIIRSLHLFFSHIKSPPSLFLPSIFFHSFNNTIRLTYPYLYCNKHITHHIQTSKEDHFLGKKWCDGLVSHPVKWLQTLTFNLWTWF